MRYNKPFAVARAEHGVLLAAIIALLAGAIIAAVIYPTAPDRLQAAREGGSLLAPPSEDAFSDAFGAPGAPPASLGEDISVGPGDGERAPSPDPRRPSPGPKDDTPPPPPEDDEGLLGLLPDLPIIPPPLGFASRAAARAVQRVAEVR